VGRTVNPFRHTERTLIAYLCAFVKQIFSVLTTYVFPDKIEFLFAFYHR
jgi:hypothetical protein